MNQDPSPMSNVSNISHISNISNVYQHSPITSVDLSTPTLSLQPYVHSYHFSSKELQSFLDQHEPFEISRDQIVSIMHRLMENIEYNSLTGPNKKKMLIDLLYFISEKNALPLNEIADSMHIISPAIDTIVLATKGKLKINQSDVSNVSNVNTTNEDQIDDDILNKINKISMEEIKNEETTCASFFYSLFN